MRSERKHEILVIEPQALIVRVGIECCRDQLELSVEEFPSCCSIGFLLPFLHLLADFLRGEDDSGGGICGDAKEGGGGPNRAWSASSLALRISGDLSGSGVLRGSGALFLKSLFMMGLKKRSAPMLQWSGALASIATIHAGVLKDETYQMNVAGWG